MVNYPRFETAISSSLEKLKAAEKQLNDVYYKSVVHGFTKQCLD